jgi:predicted porin
MYGLVDIGWGSHKTQNLNGSVSLKTSGIMDGNHAGSRIGFRGTEDLGGGMTASFVLEQGISPTSGDGFNKRVGGGSHQVDAASYTYTTSNSRQAFLGLARKGMGALRIGYQYTNSYDLVAFNGLSASEFQGGNFQQGTTLMTGTSAPNVHAAGGSRINAITWISENMDGITVKAQIGQGSGRQTFEHTGTNGFSGVAKANSKNWSLMAQYAKGPIYAGIVHTKSDQQNQVVVGQSAVNAFGVVGTAAAAATTNTTVRGITGTNIGLSYDFGMAKVTYVGGKLEGPRSTSLSSDDVKTNQYTVFVPMGAAQFFVSTGNLKRTTGTTTDADVEGTAFGVRYNLSKRTVVYAFTGSEKNKAVTTASGTDANYKDSKTVFAIAHSF